MDHHCHLLSKALLQRAAAWVLTVLVDDGVNLFLVERCEYLYVALCVLVWNIKPELVELVW